MDATIGNPAREKGLLPHVQHAVRQLVITWSRQSNEEDDLGTDTLGALRYLREKFPDKPSPMPRTISRSTTSAILCRLLSLMARLRRLTHACFHSMISRCLQLRLEHLPKKTRYLNTRGVGPSHRPQGIPYTPFDIGPPTWVEEQRLLDSFLCIVLFYELRKIYAVCLVVPVEGVQVSLHDNVEEFWYKVLWFNNRGQLEQITTVLHWLDEKAGGRAMIYSWLFSVTLSQDYGYCCQRYTGMTDKQWDDAENYLSGGDSSRGALCLWRSRTCDLSPLRCIDYSVFRPYGLVFWDNVRMDALGIPDAQCSNHWMWFPMSFILSEQDWDEVIRRQSDPSFDPRG